MMAIRLLGEQRVSGGSADAGRTPSSRSIGLLAYLALHSGMAQPRQRLAGIFWPDSSEAQARTNLRRELHNLRLLIDDDASLVVEAATLTWCDDRTCRVDVRVFDTERAAALAARAAADDAAALRHATAAIAEYRGEFMPGAYEDWVLEHRDRLRRECVELCDLATSAWRKSGDLVRAAEVAQRRIQFEPLEELGYRALMEVQAESGDRAAAVTTFHRCASALEQGLGVTPDPQTTALAERLLARRGAPPPAAETAGGRSRRMVTGRTALVGRQREVTALMQRWHEATRGSNGFVLVSGEAGVGKSRLISELVARATSEGAIAATARCFGLAGRLALAPVAEWLRSRDLRTAAAGLDPVWREEVDRLIPRPDRHPAGRSAGPGQESGEFDAETPALQAPDSGRALVDAWQRHRFFEGLARAVLATDRATLLVLDDLQWCDEATMDWLAFLLAYSGNSRLLVAATARSGELAENRSVCASLRPLRSAGLVTEIDLAPLGPADTGALAAALYGRRPTDADAALLHAATGGYPLFLVEAARATPTPASYSAPGTLTDLDGVLQRRLAQPSATAREVAGLAAAVGRDFSLDLLSEASDLDTETLVLAVDELWRHRILRELGDGYDFAHDLLRDAAYDCVSPPQRWLLHRRLAQSLEVLHSGRADGVAAQLADQYDRAGRSDRALYYLGRAAEAAVGVFANAEALRHDRRALELVQRMPPGADRDSHELAVLQAMSAPLNALYGYSSTELQATVERTCTLAERLERPRTVLASLIGLWAVQIVQGRVALSNDTAARALTLAEEHPDYAGQAHFAFAGSALILGRPSVAVTHFEIAEQLSAGMVSLLVGSRGEVHACAWEAHAHWLLQDDDRARRCSNEALERARAAEHPYSLVVALAYAAITLQLQGDAAGLGPVLAELRELCRRHDIAYYGEWGMVIEGWATGGESGVTDIRRGIERLQSQGAYARMPYWLALLAETLVSCGHRGAARAALDAALVSAKQRADRWWLPEVMRQRARLEPGPAGVDLLRRAAELADAQSSPALAARARADLAERGVDTVRDSC
jgi:DNA-binding SARP family transcriptional activator